MKIIDVIGVVLIVLVISMTVSDLPRGAPADGRCAIVHGS
jgi:hypothetical protein